MNYVRTSAGGIMRIKFKSDSQAEDKKQTTEVKLIRKAKKNLAQSK